MYGVDHFVFANVGRLEIKQTAEGSHHVPGVVEAKVDNIKDVWSVLQAGSNARAVGSNNVNEHSSRSHWFVNNLHLLKLTSILLVYFVSNQ